MGSGYTDEQAQSTWRSMIPDNQKDEPLKRGVGSQKKSKVVVMTESAFIEAPKKNKNKSKSIE